MEKHGFSLVEVLVVMLLMTLVMIGVLGVLTDMMKVRRRTEILVDMQQNARFAITTLTKKLQTTGYQTPPDVALIPDPRCDRSGRIPEFCGGTRVPETDGIVLLVNYEDRRFLRPWSNLGSEISCTDSSTPCDNTTCLSGTTLRVCSPSGFPDASWVGQPVIVCGLVNAGSGTCDWRLPASSRLLNTCGLSTVQEVCCVVRTVTSGPQCSAGCSRNAQGVCVDAGGSSENCFEVIGVNQTLPTWTATPARCQFVPPVQVLHYQIHERREPNHPLGARRYLMVRRNNDVDEGGNPLWLPVAPDVVDMQICYVLDPDCDPTRACYRWPDRPTCADTGERAQVADIYRVMIQMTVRSSRPVPRALGITENPVCLPLPDATPPEPPKAQGALVWRQYTACGEVTVRNLAYPELIPTFW